MSIGVYTMEYRNNSVQNSVQSSTQTKDETAAKAAESQQSTGTTRLTKSDIREDGTVSIVQDMQGAGAPRTDTAEISQEGRIASAKLQQQSGSGNAVQNTGVQSDETSSSDTAYEVEDLSEYSDTELKLMYYRGDITLQEYEDETGETIGES